MISSDTGCLFCENLKRTIESNEYYEIRNERRQKSRTEYKVSLVIERYTGNVDWCVGTTTHQRMPLNFCPICGEKIDIDRIRRLIRCSLEKELQNE